MTASPGWRNAVAEAIGLDVGARWTSTGGGAWTDGWRVDAGATTLFVKVARDGYADAVFAEADGLHALANSATIRVPRVVLAGPCGDTAFVALEWLDLRSKGSGATLGRALAALHRASTPRAPAGERFGWPRDNWIGGTPQRNGWRDDWAVFFRDARLLPQIESALREGYGQAFERDALHLLRLVPALLRGHDPAPSLLHGDLWSGNAGTLPDGTPVVFDPAVYVGDREADVAMTELFGGFGREFLAAYRHAWPLDAGYPTRRTLYNLYHVLNHLNLFGESYLAAARRDIAVLVAQAQ